MISQENKETLAACARMLSQLLYYPPQPEFLQQLQQGALEAWPIENLTTVKARRAMSKDLINPDLKALSQDYTRLFVGPGPLKAYPWGSVYTDKDRQLFGDSERKLKAFCTTNNIEIHTDSNQPCDHIGLVLVMLSVLLTREGDDLSNVPVQQLIDEHLLNWANEFNRSLSENAQTEFYRGVALLLDGYLQVVTTQFSLAIPSFAVGD